jgi:glutamyl-tRNA synthetase
MAQDGEPTSIDDVVVTGSRIVRQDYVANSPISTVTSEQIQERSKQNSKPGYDGYSRDRGLEPGPGRVLRFRVPEGTTVVEDLVRGRVEFANDTIEDFVLLRGNGSPMFLLANVVDDVSMRVSHVVRAEEHLPNTPKQQMLWEALGHRPPVWAHVPVLVNEQRKKLSKRRDKVALEQFRDEGYLSEAMVNYLMTLGWAPQGDEEIVPWSRIEAEFRLEDVNHSPAFFDLKKLAAFNGEYIRAMSLDRFISACEPFLTQDVPWTSDQFDAEIFRAIAPLAQTRMVTMNEIVALVDFLFLAEPIIDEAAWSKTFGGEEAVAMLEENFGDLVFKSRIRKAVKFAEAPVRGSSVLKYDTQSRAASYYRNLAKEVLNDGSS